MGYLESETLVSGLTTEHGVLSFNDLSSIPHSFPSLCFVATRSNEYGKLTFETKISPFRGMNVLHMQAWSDLRYNLTCSIWIRKERKNLHSSPRNSFAVAFVVRPIETAAVLYLGKQLLSSHGRCHRTLYRVSFFVYKLMRMLNNVWHEFPHALGSWHTVVNVSWGAQRPDGGTVRKS